LGLTAGYNLLYHRRSKDVSEELKLDSVKKKLAQYKQKCFNHVSRMEDIGYPQHVLNYTSIKRRPGRTLKRLLDRHNREAGTGHLLA